MQFNPPLQKARLVQRYKRFLADIELEDGTIITAHCANPGSMLGLAVPGSKVWISPANNPKRKLQWDWQLIDVGGALVGINTSYPNKLVKDALSRQAIPELAAYDIVQPEVKYGENSRIDFKLSAKSLPDCYVEVKSVTLSRHKGLAEFPDSKTARGLKHLGVLQDMITAGHRAIMLYLVQRSDCTIFTPAADIDPDYAQGLAKAHIAGVEILCYKCHLSSTQITLDSSLDIKLAAQGHT